MGLAVGLLRTPLPPSVTFKDDPLRVCVLFTAYLLISLFITLYYCICLLIILILLKGLASCTVRESVQLQTPPRHRGGGPVC